VYRVRILKSAAHDLAGLDKPTGQRIVERIRWLAANFDGVRIEALRGSLAGLGKLRVGDWRVIYQVLREEQILLIHAVGQRREIYRKR
jgi:mRNA interferase RelE/StbE